MLISQLIRGNTYSYCMNTAFESLQVADETALLDKMYGKGQY